MIARLELLPVRQSKCAYSYGGWDDSGSLDQVVEGTVVCEQARKMTHSLYAHDIRPALEHHKNSMQCVPQIPPSQFVFDVAVTVTLRGDKRRNAKTPPRGTDAKRSGQARVDRANIGVARGGAHISSC